MSDINYTPIANVNNVDTCQPLGLLAQCLTLGGDIVRVVDLETGEVTHESAGAGGFPLEGDPHARGGVTLSKSHTGPRKRENGQKIEKRFKIDDNGELVQIGKNPSISWVAGASMFKTSQGSNGEQVGGGVRKPISGFSSDSRRRMMYAIAGIRLDAELPKFVTLTYPSKFPTPKDSKRHLKMFCQRLKRAFPEVCGIHKLEPQERGAPHYHIIVWGVPYHDLFSFVVSAWYDIAGDGDSNHLLFHMGLLKDSEPCVSQVRSWRGVWSYASKYLLKTFEVAGWENQYTGRFWGYINHDLIPFGDMCEFELSSSQVFHVMRYQKRFSGRKVFHKGYTLFCNADQWAKNILREVRGNE